MTRLERLRDAAPTRGPWPHALCNETADKIEALQARVDELIARLGSKTGDGLE